MRPTPMSAFIPPVTGVFGIASAVVANTYDSSGVFRTRSNSVKRRRREDEDSQSAFDLTRDSPPLTLPAPLTLDVSAIRALMVDAASKAAETETLMTEKGVNKSNKQLATSVIALFKLIEAVVEKAIIPMAETGNGPNAGAGAPCPPRIPKEVSELREALETAEKSAIVFNADLGPLPLANRAALSGNFTAGLRAAAIATAGSDASKAAESVRAAADALSCASKLEFLGQSSKRTGGDGVAGGGGGFCSMPVKLSFEDRSERIHFERTLREKCGIRATISLPYGVREEQKKFHNLLKEKYSDQLVMSRPDSNKLAFIAFTKTDGDRQWTKVNDTFPIDPACLHRTPERGSTPAPGSPMSQNTQQ